MSLPKALRITEWDVVAAGNPHALRSVADLADRPLRFLNREPGSGSRALLDACLEQAGIPSGRVAGYANSAASHLDAGRAIAGGAADAAIGLQAVAAACGLDFIPMKAVRCDLVIPRDLLAHPAVAAAMEALSGRAFRDELAALPGYGVGRSGTVVATIDPAG